MKGISKLLVLVLALVKGISRGISKRDIKWTTTTMATLALNHGS